MSILLFPRKVTFFDALTIPYVPSYILGVEEEKSLRMRLSDLIAAQHEDPQMQAFYGALFLALPIPKTLREKITRLGANHLLALSGFHMGWLWAIVYGMLALLYKPLQRRYFPWRHRVLDVGLVTVAILGGYLMLTGIPPSLLRAYAMVVVGWLALLFGIELLSFSFLAFCALLLLAFFPSLAWSIGFWLSVAGVFFIYLFLHHTKGWPPWLVFLGINLWVYLAMLPVVHLFFGTFDLYQMLSPLLTLLFGLFYPLAILLHAVGSGGLLDGWLTALLNEGMGAPVVTLKTPLWFFAVFIGLVLAAVRYRVALYGVMGCVGFFLLYLIEKVT